MKSKFFALLAIVAVIGFTGCCGSGKCCLPFGGGLFGGGCADACCDDGCCGDTCCEPARCGLLDKACCSAAPASAPMTGAVAYPYYTNRGPRDFLAKNPPSIGP